MPSINIDGQNVDFHPGESIIAAAARYKITIPHYCWHPQLSVAANCRMCLVEVESVPKLVPACQTECKDGMVVHTTTVKVKATQQAVNEFILINHPIDCPICDQAGECKLQDYYMKWDGTPSRMRDQKVTKRRLEKLGPYVIYNAERCIMCTRCVRFVDEVAKSPQLGVFNRGDHAEIGIFPGKPLDSPYSLNVVDVCPVGALTSVPFRFKQRVWNLNKSPSLCGGCARGCNIHVAHRSGQVYRFSPRANEAVNKTWLCDEGRLTYQRANQNRLRHGLMRGPNGVQSAEISRVQAKAVELLKTMAQRGSDTSAAISLHATCEETYVFGRFVRDLLGCRQVAILGYESGAEDALLRLADKNPNRSGVMRVLTDLGLDTVDTTTLIGRLAAGSTRSLLVVGHEGDHLAELAQAIATVDAVVHIAASQSPLCDMAQVTLPSCAWVEIDGTWINARHRAQRLWPAYAPQGSARASHEWLVNLASELGSTLSFPSAQTVRNEIEVELRSFLGSKLSALGPEGHELASGS